MDSAIERRSPAALSHDALRQRLNDLARDERDLQVDFLLHLAEFDDRRGFAEAGYDSLWTFCLRELHLREGPTALRIQAMRLLRQHPRLEAALRDGRLCLSTAVMIAPLLQDVPLDDVVSRAAYRTKDEVRQLIASLRPTSAPRDGIRQLPVRQATSVLELECAHTLGETVPLSSATALPLAGGSDLALCCAPAGAESIGAEDRCGRESMEAESGCAGDSIRGESHCGAAPESAAPLHLRTDASALPSPAPGHSTARTSPQHERSRVDLMPVSAEQWSLRVTMDSEMKENLEALRDLLSHKTGRDLTGVLREALRCGIEKHGKRRGAVAPTRVRRSAPRISEAAARIARGDASDENDATSAKPGRCVADARAGAAKANADAGVTSADRMVHDAPRNARAIPAAVAREVWKRDEGCCTWKSPHGRRCRSRWKLQIDHIKAAGLGGEPTVDNLRLLCRTHNLLHAEKTFGVKHMSRHRKRGGHQRASARLPHTGPALAPLIPD